MHLQRTEFNSAWGLRRQSLYGVRRSTSHYRQWSLMPSVLQAISIPSFPPRACNNQHADIGVWPRPERGRTGHQRHQSLHVMALCR